MIPIFRGKIERGKLVLDYPEKYVVWLAKLEGKRIEVTVRERTTRRSDSQNRYYFGIVLPIISDNIGYDKDECHGALKMKFLSSPEDEIGLVKTKSTAKLSVDEFTQYVNKIVRWAAEYLHCYIPSPGDVDVYTHENM